MEIVSGTTSNAMSQSLTTSQLGSSNKAMLSPLLRPHSRLLHRIIPPHGHRQQRRLATPQPLRRRRQHQAHHLFHLFHLLAKQYTCICINTSSTETKLGEIIIVDRNGQTLIATDKELFTAIRQKYNSMRRRHLFAWMCIANDIHYVKFEIHRQLVGILEKPDSVPPPAEVQLGRYSHSPPPMTAMRFYNHYNEHENLSNAYERFWLDVLPTKLGTSIPTDDSQREFGWAIHIIERPRLNVIAMTALICVLLDVGVAVIYCTCTDDKDRGWTIASWIARIQTLILSSLYFHYQNM
jgi:hypothetical protein